MNAGQAKREARSSVAVVLVLLSVLLSGRAHGQEVVDLRTLHLPHWRLEEELRLGSVGGEHDAFVHLGWLKVDTRGQLYVLDMGLPALLVFDSTGRYVRQIGRKGEGPGEYTRPIGFGLLGDTVWIVDGVTRRVAFLRSGQLLEDFTLAYELPGTQAPQPFEVLGSDDFLVVIPPGPERLLNPSAGVGRFTFEQSIVRRNRSGSRVDTIVTYSMEPGIMVTQADADAFSIIPYQPIHRLPRVSYHRERDEITRIERPVATSDDVGEFRITVLRSNGSIAVDRRFQYRPVPLPESVRDSIRGDMRSRFEGALTRDPEGARKRLNVALESLDLPAFLPPVSSGVAQGEDGSRWIARESLLGVTAPRYLITDELLNPIATLELPATARLTGPRTRNHVWVVEKDDLDVEYLVRYRIIRD